MTDFRVNADSLGRIQISQGSNNPFPAVIYIAAAIVTERLIPENEPGWSIMPGEGNPTQALTRGAIRMTANDVAALALVIGCDNAPKTAHSFMDHDSILQQAASQCGVMSKAASDRVADPAGTILPYVAAGR